MARILMLLSSFHGATGDAVNERRIVQSLAQHEAVRMIYVFAVAGIHQAMYARSDVQSRKVRILTFLRMPSPHLISLLPQMILYGFFFALVALFLKCARIVDSIYVRDCYLGYGCVSIRRFVGPVAVKTVSIITDELLFKARSSAWDGLTRAVGWAVENYVIRNANIVFTVPGGFSKRLRRIRAQANGIVELPQPIPVKLLSVDEPIRHLRNEQLVGYVGAIAPIHSVDLMVRAVSLAQADMRNLRLVIVGDGNPRDLADTIGLIRVLGVRASITLRARETDMPNVYRSLDLLLIPRSDLLKEVVPLKLLEAAVAKVPVIASRGDAMYQMLKGSGIEDIVLIDSVDPHIWAEKIKALLLDGELRLHIAKRMSECLRPRIDMHTYEAVAEKLVNSLEGTDH
jgi:glycosyltransferase involved in cell wall biosynthesis